MKAGNTAGISSAEIRRNIKGIYDRFLILPNLRLHMYRTAAVAEMMCDNWKGAAINKQDIAAACLLHDIGNIVKFDLGEKRSIALLGRSAKNLKYWLRVKKDTMRRYGRSDNEATHNMLVALRANRKVQLIISRMAHVFRDYKRSSSDYELLLCEYADCRTAPYGIASVTERFADFAERYKRSSIAANRTRVKFVISKLGKMLDFEKMLFTHMRIMPEQVNDRSIKPYLEKYTKG